MGRGILAIDPGTLMVGQGLQVRGTRIIEPNGIPLAVQVSHGARLELSRASVTDNSGYGVTAAKGGSLRLWDSLLESNTLFGVAIVDAGTDSELNRTVISGTILAEGERAGGGLTAFDAATASLSACLIRGNSVSGVMAIGADSKAVITGSIVAETELGTEQDYGIGVSAVDGGHVAASLLLVTGNHTAGVFVDDPESTLEMTDSAVLSTLLGAGWFKRGGGEHEFQAFGDGLLSNDGRLDLSSVVSMGNSRCGIFYSEASGSIVGGVVAGNASYGLALNDCEKNVDHDSGGNYIFGNALDMPVEDAAQVTTNPKGLPVPAAPEVAEVSLDPLEER